MAAVTWIKMSSFLLLMLQFKAATTSPSFTVRAGHDISLPCGNLIDGQRDCFFTTWLFSGSSRPTVELVAHGQIKENVAAKSDRLSLTADCSLVIKKVTANDVGRYTCRQFRTIGGPEEGRGAIVDLSVINMTEHEKNDKVIFTCSVGTQQCRHTVQWLYEEISSAMEGKSGSCSATVTVTRSQLNQKSKFYESLTCKVTNELFPFKLKSSGEKTGENGKTTKTTTTKSTTTTTKSTTTTTKSTTTTTKSTTTTKRTTVTFKPTSLGVKTSDSNDTLIPKSEDFLWLICLPVGLAAILIIVVIIKCKKIKGNEAQLSGNTGLNLNPAGTQSGPGTNQNTAEADNGFPYASIDFTNKTKKKGRSRGGDDGDTVTYSTVKAPSSSGGGLTAPSDLYSTISLPKK